MASYSRAPCFSRFSVNGELVYTTTLPCEIMLMSNSAQEDLYFGYPYYEFDRAAGAQLWVYRFCIHGSKALEGSEVAEASRSGAVWAV